jgi:hypothetical protein
MKQYWIYLVGIAILLSGCATVVNSAPEVVGPTPVETEVHGSEILPEMPIGEVDDIRPPLASLAIDGASQTAGLGTYCWTDVSQGMGLCIDAIGIATPQDALVASSPFTAQFSIPVDEVPRDVVVTVRAVTPDIEMNETASDFRWWAYAEGETYQLPLEREPALELALEPGLYVLDLFVGWETLGDASYGFLVEVE